MWHRCLGILAAKLAQHSVEVERKSVHLEDAIADRPLIAWAVAVELDPVALGVARVERLADQMVGGSAQSPARVGHPLQGASEVGTARHEDRQVKETAGAARAGRRVRVAGQLYDRPVGGIARPEADDAVR